MVGMDEGLETMLMVAGQCSMHYHYLDKAYQVSLDIH
jgi:hypothetical protein